MSSPLPIKGYICRTCRTRLTSQTSRHASSGGKRATILPDQPVRTRFAPSPTGFLHLGSARTALFNYLIAKRTGGQFILRIEDTDAKRTQASAEKGILEELQWLGLQWDEGPEVGGPHGPYQQSQRFELYQSHVHQLLESGHAYRCFCSMTTLQEKAKERSLKGMATMYDRTCYHLSKEESDSRAGENEPFVVRLKAGDEHNTYNDFVGGLYKLSTTAARKAAVEGVWDDFILLKADGLPTYHLANVVDDHYMQITHVIRGVEWQISTPKHLSIYKAFGWTPPEFGHIGLLLNDDGSKMSKRDQAAYTHVLRKDGVLPEALVNFLALYGWSHSQRSDFLTVKDLEKHFDLNLSNTNPGVSLSKLWFLSPKHAARRLENGGQPFQELVDIVCDAVRDYTYELEVPLLSPGLEPHLHRAYVNRVLKADLKNYKNAKDFVATHSYFFLEQPKKAHPLIIYGNKQQMILAEVHRRTETVTEQLWLQAHLKKSVEEAIAALTSTAVEESENNMATDNAGISKKDIWEVLRDCLTGGEKGPSLVETMEILGREISLKRISKPLKPKSSKVLTA